MNLLNKCLRFFRVSVYVVVANDTYKGRMKECSVWLTIEKAMIEKERLCIIYGAVNVALFSRDILHKPKEQNELAN